MKTHEHIHNLLINTKTTSVVLRKQFYGYKQLSTRSK